MVGPAVGCSRSMNACSFFNMRIFHYFADGKDRRAKVVELAQSFPNFLASFCRSPMF